jgi:hypothetical protein
MHLANIIIHTLPMILTTTFANPSQARYLTIPAVTTDANNHAILECWRFNTPFSNYPTVGTSLFLANTTNITYVILPPRSAEGIHKPPSPMYLPSSLSPISRSINK